MLALGISCSSGGKPLGEMQTATFKETSKAVVNPGKGWVVYGGKPAEHSKDALDVCSSAYTRFSWSQIEPEEGQYNWTPIDKVLAAWSDAGKKFSFGVMCESYHSSVAYVSPKWVFDAGAPYITYDGIKVKQFAPKNWEDPVFLAKLKNFIDAMGKRYDGDSRVESIDIRSYGQWGEGHLGHLKGSEKISSEGLKKHIQIHLDAFRKTRLFIPWGERLFDPVYDWSVDQGVGIRRDGILGNSNGSELIRCIGKAPSFGEWYYSYNTHISNPRNHYAWGDKIEDRILDDTVRGAMTYQNLGQYDKDDLFVKNHRPFIDKLTNMMGYHFILHEASFPYKAESGLEFPVSFRWENKGLAKIFIPCSVIMALIDKDGNIAARATLTDSNPSTWMPGKEIHEISDISFNAPAGTYKLALGLFSNPAAHDPDIMLGIECEKVKGWQILGSIKMD